MPLLLLLRLPWSRLLRWRSWYVFAIFARHMSGSRSIVLQEHNQSDHDQQRGPGPAKFHPVHVHHLVQQEQHAQCDQDGRSHESVGTATGTRATGVITVSHDALLTIPARCASSVHVFRWRSGSRARIFRTNRCGTSQIAPAGRSRPERSARMPPLVCANLRCTPPPPVVLPPVRLRVRSPPLWVECCFRTGSGYLTQTDREAVRLSFLPWPFDK